MLNRSKIIGLTVLIISTLACAFSGGDGTVGNPYQISTREHLEAVNNNLSAHYILINDIDLGGTTYTNSVISNFITGTFDGNGFEIKNLTINGGINDRIGLFRQIGSGASVSNLGIVECNISGRDLVGGLCGSSSGTITSSYATGKVSGENFVGGLCGEKMGTITSSYATGAVSGEANIGGLCGVNYGTITLSYATGTVSGYERVGGLCGEKMGTIESSYATGSVSGYERVGGLCGRSSGTITSSYATGAVSGVGWDNKYVGGLVGHHEWGPIHSSYATGAVSGDRFVGGMCGINYVTITSSYATGAVSGTSSVGGLCGINNGTIHSSFWDTQTAGLSTYDDGRGKTTAEMKDINTFLYVGWNEDTFLNAGWNFVEIWAMSAPGSSLGGGYPVLQWQVDTDFTVVFEGGEHGVITSGEAIQTVAYGASAATPTITPTTTGWLFSGWDTSVDNITSDLTVTALYEELLGSGTPEDPYQISSRPRLEALNNDISAHYILMNDVDLGGVIYTNSVISNFAGKFNGNGFEIKNLRIYGGGSQLIGLFGSVASGGNVSNLGIVDCISLGNNYVGGLCGVNYGTITSSYATGAVTGTGWSIGGLCGSSSGTITSSYTTGEVSGVGWDNKYVGGLCGSNWGTITSSYATGTVSGYALIGGLCGSNWGTITSSYATGAVSGNLSVGGLCGVNNGVNNNGTILLSYATGTVSGNSDVGGLCGYNYYGGTITSSYATGAVSGNSDVGGLCGENWNGTTTSSFWDMETTGQAASAGGTGKTTAEMKDIDTFICTGWDFIEIWAMSAPGSSQGGGYPVLQWQVDTDFTVVFEGGEHGVITSGEAIQTVVYGASAVDPSVKANPGWVFRRWDTSIDNITSELTVTALYEIPIGDGTANNPYQIKSRYYWDLVNDNLSAHYILMNDIDLFRITYDRAVIAPNTDTVSNFKGTPFTGTFNGNGFKIKNLKITTGSGTYIGLFGQIGSIANVFNLGIVNCNIEGKSPVGGLCGRNDGTINLSYATGEVSGSGYEGGRFYIGGLCGWNRYGTISSSYATGAVSGENAVGGLCGRNDGTITSSYSTAVTGGGYFVGGLCGYNYGTISSSYATGAVLGWEYVGGLCGENWNGTTTSSFWDMETTGQAASAGGTGKTTAEMKDIDTFLSAGWDFVDVWAMSIEGSTFAGYPVLQWQNVPTAIAPDWTPLPLYEHFMNINVYVTQSSEQIAIHADSLLSAWIDGDCTGLNANPPITTPLGDVIFMLSASGTSGKTLTFKVYDGASGEIYDIVETAAFVPYGDYGTVMTPAELTIQSASIEFTVTFDLDGKGTRTGGGELTQTVACGSSAVNLTVTAIDGWVFVGWDTDFSNVTSDLTVTALYEQQTFTVIFDAGDSGSLSGVAEQTVIYGDAAVAPSITADYGWDFAGWDTDFSNITDDLIVTALYTLHEWTVIFDAGENCSIIDGLAVQLVAHGSAAAAPEAIGYEGFYFLGWKGDFSEITADTTIPAICRERFNGKDGISEPLEILLPDELAYLSENENLWGSDVALVGNIDCSQIQLSAIGNSFIPFEGTFNGRGFTIENLIIDQCGDKVGFFGVIGVESVVKNTGFVNCHIYAGCRASGDAAIIAAENNGTIQYCYVDGSVDGWYVTGGIAGYNTGIISNCYSLADCSGEYFVGGIAGENTGTITNCYSFAVITSAMTPFFADDIASLNSGALVDSPAFTKWDYILNTEDGLMDIWQPVLGGYPKLFWQALRGDANYDGIVDLQDLTILAHWWLLAEEDLDTGVRLYGDINLDGRVDMLDFAIMAEAMKL